MGEVRWTKAVKRDRTRRWGLIRAAQLVASREIYMVSTFEVTICDFSISFDDNVERFPEDFMFQLTLEEAKAWLRETAGPRLRSQNVTLKTRRGQHIN